MNTDQFLHLLRRFEQEGVQYVLVGGHAVRLNGFVRSTEDIDILLPSSIDNGKRVADELLIDLLFAANGQTYESLGSHVRTVLVQDVSLNVLDIEGLLKTKTDYREKDLIDKQVLRRIAQGLNSQE